jgi:hypothetical protein
MQRKTVTVLFCDVTGSTALGESIDPEALRGLLARYFERMKAIVEGHEGTVEKFIGDAVMAVFGVPTAHEDDALRAVRAAAEMRDALPELGVQARIGLTTGVVVTGTEERLATGDAVNVAARLEQAAEPGEVLLGEATLELVRTGRRGRAGRAAHTEGQGEGRFARIDCSGCSKRPSGATSRRSSAANASLRSSMRPGTKLGPSSGASSSQSSGTRVWGRRGWPPEAAASREARVVRGRCLPYGEGITYWPVAEVLKQLDVLPPDPEAAAAIRSLLEEAETPASAEEIAWAFRKTLEHAADAQPLAVVFDDIHSGEETFLDLVEHVALLSSGSPLLLVCLARPELVERRPTWPISFRLEPLPDPDGRAADPGDDLQASS